MSDLEVTPLWLEVKLVGGQYNDEEDLHAIATMWEDQILPADFGKLQDALLDVLIEHNADVPTSLIKTGK